MPQNICAEFSVTRKTLSEPFLRGFLTAISEFDNGRWRPDRYNNSEPIKRLFSLAAVDEVAKLWVGGEIGMMLKRSSAPKYVFDSGAEHNNLVVKTKWVFFVEDAFLQASQGADALLSFLSGVYAVLRPSHGHAEHWREFLSKNQRVSKRGAATVETWVGRKLERCLPGVYWANWFGPEYVQFFGREKFESAPAHRKQQLPDGGYLIVTSASPFDYEEPEAKQMERAVLEHLGAEAFFDPFCLSASRVLRGPHRA